MLKDNDILNSDIFDFPVYLLLENAQELGTGKNAKKILVCLSDEDAPDIREFLKKVTASVGFDLSNDAFMLFLPPGQQINFSSLDHEMGFDIALFFGLKPEVAGLQLNVQPYQPISFLGKTFLFADSLSTIQNKAALKRPLWEALKEVFGY